MKTGRLAEAIAEGNQEKIDDLKAQLYEDTFDWISNNDINIIIENTRRLFPNGVDNDNMRQLIKVILVQVECLS
jgi:hypothetical protein